MSKHAPVTHVSLPSGRGGYARLAQLMLDYEDELVATWIGFVGDKIASHAVQDEDLENAIRLFIAHVRERLVDGDHEAARSAAEHGQQRHRIGFHLASMVREYGYLLEAVESVVVKRGLELNMGEFGALSRHVVAGVAEATSSFVEEERGLRDEQGRRHYGFIAHELRNPIQNMGLAVASLRGGGDGERALKVLERAVEEVRGLVDKSLVAVQGKSRIGRDPVAESSPFDFVELVREVVDNNAAHGIMRAIEVVVEAPDVLPVELDRVMTRSVITNLLRNAIKFSCPNEKVILRVRTADARVHVEIEDRCGGLPEGAASKMFEPFAQMGADRTGFGLGLAITRQAVDAHNGRIQVHDVVGGCVFVVDLPLKFAPRPEDAAEN